MSVFSKPLSIFSFEKSELLKSAVHDSAARCAGRNAEKPAVVAVC
jgi:hypothetical protein